MMREDHSTSTEADAGAWARHHDEGYDDDRPGWDEVAEDPGYFPRRRTTIAQILEDEAARIAVWKADRARRAAEVTVE